MREIKMAADELTGGQCIRHTENARICFLIFGIGKININKRIKRSGIINLIFRVKAEDIVLG